MKAVIYARYSDDNQREESIEGQLRECYEYAKRHGIEVIAEYIDRAMTGRNDNRPDFQRMIKESDSKAFDLIIVWKLDRFARDKYDSALYKGMLLKKGIRVVSAAEAIPDGTEGVLLESLLEGLAQYYSMDLSIKTKRGMKENALKRKKRLCDKEMLPKVPLENFVVQKTMQLILQDDVVDHLSKVLFELQEQGSTVIPMLEQQYKEKQKEIENILGAIQKGHGVNLLLERLDLLEKQRDEIQAAIEKERIKRPVLTQEQFKMALCRYRTLDISTEEGKQKIIDTFVNAIYVYDDHFKIIYNTNGKEETVTLEELSCSNDISRGEPFKNYPKPLPIGSGFGFLVYIKRSF